MGGVNSPCGYEVKPDREPVAFAPLVNGFEGSAKAVRAGQDARGRALMETLD